MIKVCYSELDGPKGLSLRLEAAGHAGYAPAGQDIVCAGASTLMQALVYLLAGEENARSDAWDEPEGPRLAVAAQAPVAPWVQGAFELAKAGFTLLAERYPDNLRFADVSRSGQQSMMDLQLFAEGEAAPALSPEQTRQAVAAGTLKPEATAYHGTDRGAGRGGAGAAARRASAGKRPAPRCCGFGTAGRSRYDPRPAGSLGAPCAARCTN